MTEFEYLAGAHLDAKCEAKQFEPNDIAAIHTLMGCVRKYEKMFYDAPFVYGGSGLWTNELILEDTHRARLVQIEEIK